MKPYLKIVWTIAIVLGIAKGFYELYHLYNDKQNA